MIDSESSEFHAYKQGLIRYITQLFDGLKHHKYQPTMPFPLPRKQQINVAFAVLSHLPSAGSAPSMTTLLDKTILCVVTAGSEKRH